VLLAADPLAGEPSGGLDASVGLDASLGLDASDR
jgi:hypothetical protein